MVLTEVFPQPSDPPNRPPRISPGSLLWYKLNIMMEQFEYYPPRRAGTIFHLVLILLFSSGGAWAIWQTTNEKVAPQLLPYLALILVTLVAVPFLIYRLYALHRSQYTLQRGGIILQWGWRSESIPMEAIEWVYPADELEPEPQPPLIRWPGSVIGTRGLQRESIIEFIATQARDLIIISTGNRYYAISPPDSEDFVRKYQELTELGSLEQIIPETFHPARFLSDISSQRPILGSFLLGGILNISLVIWTLVLIPNRESVPLGFSPEGIPYPPLESVRLILLPIINTTAYLANLVLGLFLFRNEANRLMAYLLWGSSILIAIIFHIGMGFITR